MDNNKKTLGLAPNKTELEAEKVLPENEQVGITEVELKEQLGHLTMQLLQAQKTETHLRKVISDLRKEHAS